MEEKKPTQQSIKEQVEQKLQAAQANKDFKDIGRVAQTKKERAAFQFINAQNLTQLEEDSVMAFNMVKKDTVWVELDINAERERGVSAGAAYLKVKIRESVPTKPKDNKASRSIYVLFLDLFQKDLFECFTIEHIAELINKYKNFSTETIVGYFLEPRYLELDEQKKQIYITELTKTIGSKLGYYFKYGGLFRKLVEDVFGARFENMLFKGSDAAAQIWQDAKDKEPITEEESNKLIAALKEREAKFIQANREKQEKYRNYVRSELINAMDTEWRIDSTSKKNYKANIEEFRVWVINFLENKIKKELEVFKLKELKLKPRDNDWSWFEKPKTRDKSEDKPKEKAINTKQPLAYIKRTGGYKIENYSPAGIVEKFGFSAVNYGNYVDNAWSKEHTKHFLGAICDMAEMLNIDIKKMNELGKLAIAFGAKGRKGHAAAYFPQTKDINLTKGNGDGSVAHEWGHYLDNVIVELSEKKATNNFASEGSSNDFEIKMLFKELFDFIHKGNEEYTPLLPVTFYPKKSNSIPSYSVRTGSWSGWETRTLEIKPTIEETLEPLKSLAVIDKDRYNTQLRLFGYIIDAFGLESYKIPMKLKTSYFYHKTAYALFNYCYKKSEDEIEMAIHPRTKYWTSNVELFARAFETVVLKKLLDKGRVSNYLVDDIPKEDIVAEGYSVPYPMGKELEYIETIIDRIIIAIKKIFNVGDFVAPSIILEDDYVEFKNDESGKTEAAMVVTESPLEDKKEIDFVVEDKVVETVVQPVVEEPIVDNRLDEVEKKKEIILNEPTNNLHLQTKTEENGILEPVSQRNIGKNDEISTRARAASFIRDYVEFNIGNIEGNEIQKGRRRELEKQAAFEFANQNNLWFDSLYHFGNPQAGGGNENTLATDFKNGYIYKSNNLSNSNNSILEFLEQVKIHNKLFPYSAYELVGFTGFKNAANDIPYVEPILKQKFVVSAINATEKEIEEYMTNLGFQKIGDYKYSNGKYTVADLRTRNVLKDKQGDICVIDNIITKNEENLTKDVNISNDVNISKNADNLTTNSPENINQNEQTMTKEPIQNYDRFNVTIQYLGKPKEVEIEVVGKQGDKYIVRLHKKYTDVLHAGKKFTVTAEDLLSRGVKIYSYNEDDFKLKEDSPFIKKESQSEGVKDYTESTKYFIDKYEAEIANGTKTKQELVDDIKQQLAELNKTKEDERFESFYKQVAIYNGLLKHFASNEKTFEDKRQALDEFFTPKWVAEIMYKLAVKHGFKGGKVCEPSFGKGVFFDVLTENGIPEKDLFGFEIYKPNFDYVKNKYPKAILIDHNFEYEFAKSTKELKRDGIIINQSFLDTDFDMFIGNPPYGSHISPYSHLFDKNAQIRYEGFFILLALQKLKSNGLCVFIINSLWMNNGNKYNKQKEMIAKYGELIDSYRLPNGIFKGENRDTNIATDIVIFKKY